MSSSPSVELVGSIAEVPSHAADLYELTKPRMNMLVVITTMVGAYMGSREAVPWLTVLNVCIGTALTASSAGTLNQFLERGYDTLMLRTRNRPLPAGRINLLEALLFGVGLGVAGLVYLALFVNLLTFFIAAITLLSYLLVYTPLKRVSSLNTLVGGIPGALPAVMGFTAVQNHLSIQAWLVFLIMFVWQMPHFLAIATMYKDDYERGGFKMLPGVDPQLSGQQMLLYTMALIPISIAPCIVRMSGLVYFVAALVMGLAFLYYAIPVARTGSRTEARRLFFASIIYLPILFSILMIDKI
ncbi:MAG TPA: heme o synthase [Tepidisphaeraceae bacterium]|jgi:protoheme IX farnesyltransferase